MPLDRAFTFVRTNMGYRFFRNSLIKVAILSMGVCAIFYDSLTGKKVASPAALVLLGTLVVFGNGWLTYMMLKARKREQKSSQGGNSVQITKPVAPATRAKRKQQRGMFLVFLFAAGLFLVVMGLFGWSVDSIPAYYLGALLLVFGAIGLCGVNIWKGGPFDPTHDPPEPRAQVLIQAAESPPPGVWPPPPSQPAP